MTWCFLLIAVVVIFFTSINRKDFFAPATFFILLYSGLLAIYFLKLTPLQTPWTPLTHVLLWGSMGMYLGGCVIVYALALIRDQPQEYSFEKVYFSLKQDAATLDWARFQNVLLICATLFFITFLDAFITSGCILPAFSSNPDEARYGFGKVSIMPGNFMHLGTISLMLAFEMIIFKPVALSQKKIPLILLVAILFLNGSIGGRLDIFRVILFGIVLFNYGKSRITFKTIFLLVCSGITIFLLYALMRGTNHEALSAFSTTLKLHMPKEYIWAANFYGYIINNFWNFDYGIRLYAEGNNYLPFSYGFSLFRGFFGFTGFEGAFISMFNLQDLLNSAVVMVKGLNTVYFAWHFYNDFGFFGVFFLSLFFGMTITLFYCNTMIHTTLVRCCIWAIIIGMIFFSFMVPLWEFWMTSMNILLILIAHKRICLLSPTIFATKTT